MSSSPINQPAASRTSSSPDPAPLNAYEDVAETTNPTPRKRKRKNSSPCWDDFVEIVRPDKVRRWQCKHCKHDFAQNSSGTTSHLRTHLKNYCTAKRRSEQGQRTLENYCIAGRRSEQGQRTLEMSCVEHPAMLLTNGGGKAMGGMPRLMKILEACRSGNRSTTFPRFETSEDYLP
ncbi:uncharacterized protein A4U43_C07F37080 [Asparagus officinalis]|uniref:BED-type domain-containing protein n=1 Tax=Asparagus officinalis TaxID=4686 RepID=A0A5P1EI30_ASPOF|nr:uncharacterized protein A4U43_C07F37080 [Asparagus officinalis]